MTINMHIPPIENSKERQTDRQTDRDRDLPKGPLSQNLSAREH